MEARRYGKLHILCKAATGDLAAECELANMNMDEAIKLEEMEKEQAIRNEQDRQEKLLREEELRQEELRQEELRQQEQVAKLKHAFLQQQELDEDVDLDRRPGIRELGDGTPGAPATAPIVRPVVAETFKVQPVIDEAAKKKRQREEEAAKKRRQGKRREEEAARKRSRSKRKRRDKHHRRARGRRRGNSSDKSQQSSSSAGSTSERDEERFKNRNTFGALPIDAFALTNAIPEAPAGAKDAVPSVAPKVSSLPASTKSSLEGIVEFTVGVSLGGETAIIKEFQVEAIHLGNSMVTRKETLERIATGHGVAMSLVRDGTVHATRHRLRVCGSRVQVEAAAQGVHIRVEGARREQSFVAKQQQVDAVITCIPGGWLCTLCTESQYATNTHCFRCAAPKPINGMANPEDLIRVDQQWIGHILGKGGAFFKALQQYSGASIHLDQSTKEHGFSLIKIANMGTPEATKARYMLVNKINELEANYGRLRR